MYYPIAIIYTEESCKILTVRSAEKEPSIVLFFMIYGTYLFGTIPIFSGIAVFHKLFDISSHNLKSNLGEYIILAQTILTILLVFFFIFRYKAYFFGGSWREELKTNIMTGMKWSIPLVFYHTLVITVPILRYNLIDNVSKLENISIQSISSCGLISFFCLMSAGAILEELLFRGILLNKFLSHFNSILSLIISSTIFSITHFIFYNIVPGDLINHFFIGILCGSAFLKYRSCLSAIIPHFLNNLIWFIYVIYVVY